MSNPTVVDDFDPNTVPDDLGPEGDTFDTSSSTELSAEELSVNFTDAEAAAESFTLLQPGRYQVVISKIEIGRSTSVKNPGKPFYKVVYTITDGPAKGRKLFDNIMLFEGALYSLSQLLKAIGVQIGRGVTKIPTVTELLDRALIVRVIVEPPKTVAGKTYDSRNTVKGYFPAASARAVAGEDDLEP